MCFGTLILCAAFAAGLELVAVPLQDPVSLWRARGDRGNLPDGIVGGLLASVGDFSKEQWQVRTQELAGGSSTDKRRRSISSSSSNFWDSVEVTAEGPSVPNPCATAYFSPLLSVYGWNFLSVSTSDECSDVAQAFGAGYLEGRLTWKQMWEHYQNEFGRLKPSERLVVFLGTNMEYVEGEVQRHVEVATASTDQEENSFWWQVGLLLAQLKGLEAGYTAVAPPEYSLSSLDFQILSLHGDLEDLEHILALAEGGRRPGGLQSVVGGEQERGGQPQHQQQQQQVQGWRRAEGRWRRALALAAREWSPSVGSRHDRAAAELENAGPGQGPKEFQKDRRAGAATVGALPLVYPDSCSALVKLLPENADLVTSQAMWGRLETMLRVYKLYSFSFHRAPNSSELIPGHAMTFSGYPGRLFSGDDFYITAAQLTIQETTIGNSNEDLYKSYVKPEGSVLEWMRNMVANRLASSGEEWASFFGRYNSGTYNNQWMVVDHKRFTPGTPPGKGTLWVLEQIPGHIEARDMTPVLVEQGYWASYNIPAFPGVFNLSGYAALVEEYGDFFSYHRNARARMFARDHDKVVDEASMQRLMRYNDYKNDPLSKCNCTPPYSAELAIAARGDLNLADGTYELPYFRLRDHGETDAKISSSTMLADGNLNCIAISGPTWDQQPPFRWSSSPFANISHLGHPDLYLFPWISISTK